MARDHQLLKTTRDYFQFATNFFEVINVSATHIYHSALELSPLSSTVRKLYYYQRPHPSPRVVIGNKDSWRTTTVVSNKHAYYLSSTWSPCGQFAAMVASEAVEIWDVLTLRLSSTLHSTKVATKFRSGLAYSPDGHSLAGCSSTGIVVWDIQTGGEVTEIGCEVTGSGLKLVWSSDGKIICMVSPPVDGVVTVNVYDITSGSKLSTGTLQSRYKAYLWAHGNYFRFAAITEGRKGWTINIFEVGSTLTRVESFPSHLSSNFLDFSPTTYRVSVFTTGGYLHNPELLISDLRNSNILLRATGSYKYPSFSPDADVFGAFTNDHLLLWKYTSDQYNQWRKLQQTPSLFQFSPTSSSIFFYAGALLHVLNLDHSPAILPESTVAVHSQCYDAFSPHGTFIATAYSGGSTITITNLNSQNPFPSQFIDTELVISAMILTGNILLVTDSKRFVAWLLTEEGIVDGIFGNTRADNNDSLWDISPKAPITRWQNSDRQLEFSVKDETAVILMHGFNVHAYHTGTGEVFKQNEAPQHLGSTNYCFHAQQGRNDCNCYHHDMCKQQRPPKCEWPISESILQDGWVKDPEGRHQLWLHPHWRTTGNDVDWLYNATTLRLKNSSELVIVKF